MNVSRKKKFIVYETISMAAMMANIHFLLCSIHCMYFDICMLYDDALFMALLYILTDDNYR